METGSRTLRKYKAVPFSGFIRKPKSGKSVVPPSSGSSRYKSSVENRPPGARSLNSGTVSTWSLYSQFSPY